MITNVQLFNKNQGNWPGLLDEFVKWIKEMMALIPEEYRETAIIDIENIVITYERPSTPDEIAEQEKYINLEIEREKAELRRLLKKYPEEKLCN